MANISNITAWANEYHNNTKEESSIKRRKAELKAKLVGALEALGVRVLELPNGLKVRLDGRDTPKFDEEAFQKDYPKLYAQYLKMNHTDAFSIKGEPRK